MNQQVVHLLEQSRLDGTARRNDTGYSTHN
jgi:hypothetical protein